MKKRLRQILPWVVAIVIFFFMFRKIPPANVLKTMGQADFTAFVIYAVGYFVIVMLIDCVGLRWAISRFSTQVSFRETILMRGATYLLMLVNYNLAQGGMAFYLRRTHKAPVFKTLGTIFFLTITDLSLMTGCGVVAAVISDVSYRGLPLKPFVEKVALFFYAFLLLWILFWKYVDHPFVKPALRLKPFQWLINHQVFSTFRQLSWSDYAKTVLFRTPVVIFILVSFFFWLHAFRSHVPLVDVLTYSPIILVIGTLPITPAGIGTVQALCVEFFRTNLSGPLLAEKLYSPSEIIMAASLLWGLGNFVLKMAFGFYCLKKKSRSLFEEV